MMVEPKYPHDLSILLQSDNHSSAEEKQREGWIMSTSKSFCGATAALMAADDKFGPKKMDATLAEVLNEARKSAANRYQELEEDPNQTIQDLAQAKEAYASRIDTIAQYEEVISSKGYGDVTLSELLSHRSGLEQGRGYFTPNPEFEGDHIGLLRSDMVPYNQENKGKVFSYNNPGFMLAEDLMGLASDSGSYELEIKSRITDPLGMQHTKSIYQSSEAQQNPSEIIYVKDVVSEDWSAKSEEDFRQNPMKFTQTGDIPASAGGLCSSISDLEIYSTALSEMVCGVPNALTQGDKAKAEEVRGFYLDAYHLGDECTIPGKPSPDMVYAAKHYSLGIFVGAVDEQENQVASRENKDQRLFFKHDGNFCCYDAGMKIVMEDVSFAAFEDGEEFTHVSPKADLLIEQSDMLMRHSIQTLVSHDYAQQMDEYFSRKSEKNDPYLADSHRKYWQHLAVVKDNPVSVAWQDDLIQQDKLPSNFADYHDQVRDAYKPAQEALKNYFVDNGYIKDDGIIDSDMIKRNFATAARFQIVEEMLAPHLEQARQKTQDILLQADKQLIAENCFDRILHNPDPRYDLENSILKPELNTLLNKALKRDVDLDNITTKEELVEVFAGLNKEAIAQIDRSFLRGRHNITESPSLEFEGNRLSGSSQKVLSQYVDDKDLSVVMSLSQGDASSNVTGIEGRDETTIFNINSVGKVMTGSLVMKLVQEGVIKEEQLNQPVQLDDSVLERLSEDVRERLKTTTLHQLMTHKSGLTDFFGGESGFIKRLEDGIETGDMPQINKLEDFLEYAQPDVVDLKEGEKKYSNLGLLLVGLAVENAYNKQAGVEPLAFEEILDKYVIEPAKMTHFSSIIPEDCSNCCVNERDGTAPYMPATPDGGQWSNLESLNKFNQWFCDQWQEPSEKGPSFKELVEKYGQEFYNAEDKVVDHSGASPSSSSYLTILLPENEPPTSLVVLSDKRFDAASARNLVMPPIKEHHSSQIIDKVDQQSVSEIGEVVKVLGDVIDNVEKSFVERFAGDRQEESSSWRDRVSSHSRNSSNSPSLP